MTRLVVHIGTHKTGTTTIQRTLSANRQQLLARSINYPNYSLIGRKPHYAHLGMANALAGDHPNIPKEAAEDFFRSVRSQAEEHQTTLISAESMYRQVIGEAPQNAISREAYWKGRIAYINRVHEVLGSAEIVMVVRRQADFAESMYQEHVKVTRYGKTFLEFLKEFWFHFEYYQQAKAWAEVFGNIKIIRFDDIKGKNIAENFLNFLSIDAGPLRTIPNQNESLSHEAVMLKRILNVGSYPREQLREFSRQLTELKKIAPQSKTRRSFFNSDKSRNVFQDGFLVDNEKLEKLVIGLRGSLFEPFDDNREFGDAGDINHLASLASKLSPSVDLRLSTPKGTQTKMAIDLSQPFTIELPKHRLHYTPKGDTLVVIFDKAQATRRQSADLSQLGLRFVMAEGHSVLGVTEKSYDWYRDPELHDTLQNLKSDGFFGSFSDVIMMGSAMGGFGATAFASLSPGCRVLAFNPQSTLYEDLVPWEAQHSFSRSQSLSDEFSDGPEGVLDADSVFIIYDPFLKKYRLHADRYRSKNVHHLRTFFMGHALPESFSRLGILEDTIRKGIDGTLDSRFLHRAIRSRRDLINYKTQLISALARYNHPKAGLYASRWAMQDESKRYFQNYEALFTAALGDLPEAGRILDEIQSGSRSIQVQGAAIVSNNNEGSKKDDI